MIATKTILLSGKETVDLYFRHAATNDLMELRQLITRSFLKLSSGHYSHEEIMATIRHVLKYDLEILIADRTYLVAEALGRIVGCGGWCKRSLLPGENGNKDVYFLNPKTEAAKIRANFVHPDWKRRGIASEILKLSCREAKQAGFKKLELLATLNGEPLYRANGFRAVERINVPFPNHIEAPAIRMVKHL